MLSLARKLFGSASERMIRSMQGRVAAINALEPSFAALSDRALHDKTGEFRDRIANGASLDSLLEQAFALVREASKRTLGLRHFDVQLIGGMVLHKGGIAEMRTGEGKTLVATLPCYLNALEGKGVHLVTVNDYLAKRDAAWMGQIYEFLGLSVGVIVNGLTHEERRRAYVSDITYGTNNEFGFDYLRDNLVYDVSEMVQRGHHFAIVDEVDSILIDEARTPLIISGPTEDRSEFYRTIDTLIKTLIEDKETFEHDEKQRQVVLTEYGNDKVEDMIRAAGHLAEDSTSLYDGANVTLVHHVNQALRANVLYVRDRDYIIKSGEVILIDEFTGRMMTGRRLSEGLHQAIEAQEGVAIQPENQTLASVTIQNYFRLYKKLSGMTGTATTEAQEFGDIYDMDVLEIPTNRPVSRIDDDDEVYRTSAEKNEAILKQITECYVRSQPILVGTTSIEKSEQLSERLKNHEFEQNGQKRKGIPHQVLNARFHEQEAYIVAEAGIPGAVTIATNMAGRGTDIQLGGNLDMHMSRWQLEKQAQGFETTEADIKAEETKILKEIEQKRAIAIEAGGLYVLGTERHESRRIDNQLRGRTGRQGDPGHSKFLLSTEDDLLRIFAGERLENIMRTFGLEEGEAITHRWLNSAIATAQKKVEQRNYEVRKNLLKYDNVINDQRKAVFEQRQEFLTANDLADVIAEMRRDTLSDLTARFLPLKTYAEQWDIAGLAERLEAIFGLSLPLSNWIDEDGITPFDIEKRLTEAADRRFQERELLIGSEAMRSLEKNFLLQTIDIQWREHLQHLDHLRQAVGLRGYAQRDPLNEYKTEAFALFEKLLVDLRQNVTRWIMTVEIVYQTPDDLIPRKTKFREVHQDPLTGENRQDTDGLFGIDKITGLSIKDQEKFSSSNGLPKGWERTGRNAPCPCGSGKKFKHCHGALV